MIELLLLPERDFSYLTLRFLKVDISGGHKIETYTRAYTRLVIQLSIIITFRTLLQ